jgi:integrase
MARHLAEDSDGEVLAWQYLILAMTGCRTSEILQLRMDATAHQAGHIENDWLWVKRAKGGCNPYVVIHPALRQCIEAHHRWHAARYPDAPFWFPTAKRSSKTGVVDPTSLIHAIARVAGALGLAPRTGHGLRAYYVTMRRNAGISDGQIAAEIGDRSVALIATTYGAIPPGWRGGPDLTWLPTDGTPPAWADSFLVRPDVGTAPVKPYRP